MSPATPRSAQERALAHVAGRAFGPPLDPGLRVTLNFHPDRLCDGRPILDAMAEDGVYRSQFVTGTSNRMFGGAYDDAPAHERPVYGALNFRRKPVGAAPRFGSAHFRLAAGTSARTTFCYPDSFLAPAHFGSAARMGLIGPALADRRDDLDDSIEAQVHGAVRPACHAEVLVLDPCYRGTAVEEAALRLGCPVEWHPGFRLAVRELLRHSGCRGPEYVDLGARIAVGGVLDPRAVGDAARTGDHDPQALKKVWHCLARFGAPGTAAGQTALPAPARGAVLDGPGGAAGPAG